MMASYALTKALLSSDEDGYRRATQSEFLRAAANGQLSKDTLGRWLANDRLYIHAYNRGTGRFLSFLQVPDVAPGPSAEPDSATKLFHWLVDALVNVRREERFFVDTAAQHGININLEADRHGKVPQSAKLEGLRRWESLFESVAVSSSRALPWLEAAIVYWGTEVCYLNAWSWAKDQLRPGEDVSRDADGGAVRSQFINNWTSEEFVTFVDQLGAIIDDAVSKLIDTDGEGVKRELFERAQVTWRQVLVAEETFWPKLED